VWLLALKLLLTPAIVVGTTMTGRRFGSAVSGWLVALPLMSGPLTAFFAVEHGRGFAARASVGSLEGTLAEAAFCLGWAVTARTRSWPYALTAASAGFAAVGLAAELLPLDERVPLPLAPLALAALLSLGIAFRLLPRLPSVSSRERLVPRWDLPTRAATATLILLLLTGFAEVLGARLSGLLAVYPLYSAVLAGFAQQREGAAAAVAVLRGLLLGLTSFVVFYVTLAVALPRATIVSAFATATLATLAVHAAVLRPLRRGAAAPVERGAWEAPTAPAEL
jgi:hypothetical protein